MALLNADVTKEEWQTAAVDGRSRLCSSVWAESRKLWATLYMGRVQPTEPVEPARIKPILLAPYGLV